MSEGAPPVHTATASEVDESPQQTPEHNPGRKALVLDVVGLAARLTLGIVLLVAGGLKVQNLEESQRAVRAYQLLPYDLANIMGTVLPIVEIIVGILLILGLFTRVSAAIGALMMLAFVFGISWAWAKGLSIDCGCFGGGGEVENGAEKYPMKIAQDLGLAILGIWLVVRPSSLLSLDKFLYRK